MHVQILPLAVTMMAGPQIMSAIVLVTGERPIRTSIAFIAAVATAASLGVLLSMGIAEAVGTGVKLSDDSEPSTTAKLVQLAFVGLLIVGAIHTYVKRDTIKPPKWLDSLQTASTARAFGIGILLIGLMPTDVLSVATVGLNLVANDLSWFDAIPFLALTVLIAALPLIFYLAFKERAEVVMPTVRQWMKDKAWVINIAVYGLFIFMILS